MSSDLTGIPVLFMRGGTSSGPYWNLENLPKDIEARDRVILAAQGTTDFSTGFEAPVIDPHQLGGLGKATSVTSKTAMLSKSDHPDAQVDYLFAQVDQTRAFVDTKPNCGNILSAVGYAALEMGMVEIQDGTTSVMIHNVNTGAIVEQIVQTPNRTLKYTGDARIDGVAGTAAAVQMNFMGVVGSKTGKMFPTGNRTDLFDGLTVSCVDVATPMVWFRAAELGLEGNETKAELDNAELNARMEKVRVQASIAMGMGDPTGLVLPKMGIASKPRNGGTITSRYFVPQNCHPTHAVTGGLNAATAQAEPGTVVHEVSAGQELSSQNVVIEHPSGTMEINLTYENGEFAKGGVVRTAKKIMAGEVFVPSYLFG